MNGPQSLELSVSITGIHTDDTLHDFAGPHSAKGSDFASYWVIFRVVELERAQQPDYLFVCEYLQDVAEFDSPHAPSTLKLYQLKKKEGGYWSVSDLTGQTKKSKVPKADRPIMKLIAHVLSFQSVRATGAFVSNSKFDIGLATGQSSVNDENISLHLLDSAYSQGLKDTIAATRAIQSTSVDLKVLELRYTNLALDDLQRHMNGVMLEYIAEVAPEHINQTSSLVDTLFSVIRARARRTAKCASLADLVTRRGFGRASFSQAVASLKAIPDTSGLRQKLLETLSTQCGWQFYERGRIEIAMTNCAREKIIVGAACRWTLDKPALVSLCEAAMTQRFSDKQMFEAVCAHLTHELPALQTYEANALAIYEITEWIIDRTPA